jgi:hypothetical protein
VSRGRTGQCWDKALAGSFSPGSKAHCSTCGCCRRQDTLFGQVDRVNSGIGQDSASQISGFGTDHGSDYQPGIFDDGFPHYE